MLGIHILGLVIIGTLLRIFYAFIATDIIRIFNVPYLQEFKTMHVWALLIAIGIARGGFGTKTDNLELEPMERVTFMWTETMGSAIATLGVWFIAYLVRAFVYA